jgi:hypothetical protein
VFGLGTIAGNIVSPLLSALLATWQPLENPKEPIGTFLKWKKLLTDDAYNSLLWQHYVPHITTAAEYVLEIIYKTYIHTYHSRFIREGVAEAS